jgi:MoaA/NifB/PqqE/SkfB family radical SAM enzyme
MDPVQATEWLVELCEAYPLESITIHGGEPFLYLKEMLSILEKARELNIPRRWTITNGFWVGDRGSTIEKLRILREAGLTAITFSVDVFHQEFVSFERVKTGIECAVMGDFDTVAVDSYFLFSLDKENKYNKITRKYLGLLSVIPHLEINRYIASFEGRATGLLAERYPVPREIPSGRCGSRFWLGGDIRNPTTVEIDYQGNVTLCPGISIGNANKESLVDILQRYDYRSHPIMKIVVEEGPVGLLKEAKEKGYRGIERFSNECHLCYEMRKYLHPHYPQYLTPFSVYENG